MYPLAELLFQAGGFGVFAGMRSQRHPVTAASRSRLRCKEAEFVMAVSKACNVIGGVADSRQPQAWCCVEPRLGRIPLSQWTRAFSEIRAMELGMKRRRTDNMRVEQRVLPSHRGEHCLWCVHVEPSGVASECNSAQGVYVSRAPSTRNSVAQTESQSHARELAYCFFVAAPSPFGHRFRRGFPLKFRLWKSPARARD